MKYQDTNYYRNIAVLTAVFVFAAFGFFGNTQIVDAEESESAAITQTKKKATPTPKKSTAKSKATPKPTPKKTTAKTKATPKPTPKKTTAKATPKPTPKKTNAKTKPTPTPSKNTKTTANTKKPKPTPTKKPTTTAKTTTTKKPTTTKSPTATVKSTPKPTTTQSSTVLQKVLINAPSVAVRSSASSSGSELTRAKLGSTYSVVEKKSGWYRVQLPNQKSGWIVANSTINSDENNETAYGQIVAKHYKAQNSTFTEAVEMYDFLTRILPEVKTANTAADFGLKRLLSLRYALAAIPSGSSDAKPYQDFLKAQDENIVYSDPAGAWFVRAPLFWDLHSKYTNTPTGEQIAWEGAKTPLPGECEGYVNCYIFMIRMTEAEYLNYYPAGKHSAEALTNIINFLEPITADATEKKIYNGPTETGDRAEFNSLITEIRVILSRMPNTEKERAIGQLKKIADGFR